MSDASSKPPHLIEPSGNFQTLHEFVQAARNKLPDNIWDYLIGGTETETTVRRNRHALDSVAFRPRVCRDVSRVDCSTHFLGRPTRLPVILAPVGSLESFHPGGAAEAHRGAASFGVPIMVSSVTKPTLEETGRAAEGRHMFQLYVRGDDAFVDDYVRRANDAGYELFCITVDSAVYSRRERDIARRFVKPWRQSAAGLAFQAAFDWDKVRRFKDKHKVPLALKGIVTAEDARIACDLGVDVVYVTNHGGRQLDHGRGALDVLPEVVQAVAGRAAIVIDGGFCRGTDILKAVALGADAVAVGRLYCYGLAAEGAAGVSALLELLETETAVALALIGVTKLADLDSSYLHAAHPVAPPHVHSAFPLLQMKHDAPFSPVTPDRPG
jgi:isopentenyl diphosphate isomerase/L-lactate dehydrogenase-like FMN-dependent dehydrogenase